MGYLAKQVRPALFTLMLAIVLTAQPAPAGGPPTYCTISAAHNTKAFANAHRIVARGKLPTGDGVRAWDRVGGRT